MRLARITRRGWTMILGLVGGVVAIAAVAWSSGDSWPARLVIVPRDPIWSGPQGFSADGRWFLTSESGSPNSWDLATGRAQGVPPGLVPWQQSFAGDRLSFVGAIRSPQHPWEMVRVDVASGQISVRLPIPSLPILTPLWEDGDRSVRFFLADPQGDLEVVTWDLASGQAARRPLAAGVGRLNGPKVISPDGQTLACEDLMASGVQLWDVATDRPLGRLLKSPTTLLSGGSGLAFSRDGRTLLVGQRDGKVEFWDIAGARLIKVVQVHSPGFLSDELVLAPDGQTLAASGTSFGPSGIAALGIQALRLIIPNAGRRADDEVVLFDLASDKVLARAADSLQPRFSPDGRWVMTHKRFGGYAVRAVPQPNKPHQ